MIAPLKGPPIPYQPHSTLVAFAIVAGVLMILAGAVRLRLPTPRDSPYSSRSIRVTYSLMIALGVLLVVLAVRWRFSV